MNKRLPKVRKPKGSPQSPAQGSLASPREVFFVLTLISSFVLVVLLAATPLLLIIAASSLAYPAQDAAISDTSKTTPTIGGKVLSTNTSNKLVISRAVRRVISPKRT